MARKKIALIGAALLAGIRQLGDVVLYDVVQDLPQGKALDLLHLTPVFRSDFSIKGTNTISDIEGADVCIVTSGIARKPGMSRDDLIKTNAEIVRSVGEGIRKYAPESFVIVVTNPLDAMTWLMQKATGFPASRVVGMAGVLDSARYRAFLAEALGVSVASVSALVLGGHGDDMVPLRAFTSVNGVPISHLLSSDELDAIEKRVRGAGAEVIALLKTGSAFYSPAASAIEMAESYLHDQKKLIAAAAQCNGEFGISGGIYIGVPVILGAKGVEKIVEVELTDAEKKELQASVERVKGLIELCG
jgi:malate dehydrogenase